MPSIALTLNNTLLVYQPKIFRVINPEPSQDTMEEGNVQGSSNTYGVKIIATFGPWAEAIAELRARRGGLDEVRVQYNDPVDSTPQDRQMLWAKDPDFTLIPSWTFEDITVEWVDLG